MIDPIIFTAIEATYTPQLIQRMQGNPLIEALPTQMDDDELMESLSLAPDFAPEQRKWNNPQRIQQIKSLGNFMLPLERHLELARMLDTMIREGYVGRAPRTKEVVAQLRKIYEMQKAGQPFRQSAGTIGQQDSAALLGVSGMGKTTTVRRHLATYPRVIYHPELDVAQVSYIHVDIPSDGGSVKALAIAIISQLDKLLPECGYHKDYLTNTGRTSAEVLIYTVGRLMTLHHVGVLVADEVQNLCNSKKGAQTVMTELVTMCNTLSVPILFIGTNKAAKVLSADFRQARRSTGMGIAPWARLPRHDDDGYPGSDEEDSEWAEFMTILWEYQWVQQPVPISEEFLNTFYRYTQGVLDLAIKLFAIAQARAILEGQETLSLRLIEQVYHNDFRLLHESIEAIANNDTQTLALYEDVAPFRLDEALATMVAKNRRKKAMSLLTQPGDPDFQPRMAGVARAAGFSSEQAELIAQEIQDEGIATNVIEGLGEVYKKTKPIPTKKAASPLKPVPSAAKSQPSAPSTGSSKAIEPNPGPEDSTAKQPAHEPMIVCNVQDHFSMG